jgi:O-antigen biosynthesis protein
VASGDFLIELDHDDKLASTAIEKIMAAFEENPEVGFVYSHTAQINADGSRNDNKFNLAMGWTYKDVTVDGQRVLQCNAMPHLPSAVSYIWFAPNHVRAFRKSTYEAVGGYDAELDVLDDQDLMSRIYQHSDFHLIDECLYLQRIHAGNTQRQTDTNKLIQVRTREIYERDVQKNALAWAKRNDLMAIDLGAAHSKPKGYLGIDQHLGEGVDFVADLTDGMPFKDNQVGVIRAVDFLEHIPDKITIFNEMYRVLVHGGMLLSLTPSTDGRGAFQDPTHVSFYNENSMWYFTDSKYSKFVPEIKCKFQVSFLKTIFPTQWHRANNISYVQANLVAIKDGPRLPGLLNY